MKEMKKMLKSKKGFSLIELLIVLAILAVIAALSITMFGGIIGNSKTKADKQQAANIKRAIQTFLSDSNDINFSAYGKPTTVDALLLGLASTKTIGTGAGAVAPDEQDNDGTYGPYLESGSVVPQDTTNTGWAIVINKATQVISVAPATNDSLTIN